MNELIENNLGLVYSYVKKNRWLQNLMEYDDLIGYGMVGLTIASRRYDPSKGTAFSTFAYFYISGTIKSAIRDMSGFIASKAERGTYRVHKPTPFSFYEGLNESKQDKDSSSPMDYYIHEQSFEDESILNAMLDKFKASLDEINRTIFEKCILQGIPQREVAEIVGMRQGSISRKMRKMDKQLIDILTA
ncbi:sigma-70 family RNA polymerase sigma factor [Inconstantimicrobium mannanitabidum]|uniref:Uncharacterized protein n=1 Tax=Inconstantimicrobium mannanitabidum TaxID=1604901 RepID=A0ACB5R8U0_9CLOT|nr:sigma-70 family RNA polymerase sigma factor [Clostridium sp. TW13]GKX65613.1 hypothetical protein rsdtw13_08710 [Clostridium sp. TW13]